MVSDPLKPSDIFTCKKCGDCCKGYGGTFVTTRDIRRIADFIQVDPSRFVAQYCRFSGDRPVLSQNSACVDSFLDDNYLFFKKDTPVYPVSDIAPSQKNLKNKNFLLTL